MSNWVRILLVIACIAALYYLVVTLARTVGEDDLGHLGVDPGAELVSGGVPMHARGGLFADSGHPLG